MADHYDIAIIGSGPGGYIAALKAGQKGASVAIVENDQLGGTCLNNGCIPSKALLATAERLHKLRNASEMGISVDGEVGFDWTKVQKRKDKVLRTLRNGINGLFRARKVKLYKGTGTLDGQGKVAVKTSKGKTEQLTADSIIIATGSVPATIPGWPADEKFICTSDHALHWNKLPKHLLIVGGGYIGCEFACMMKAFDVEVTLVEMMPRLLPPLDADMGKAMEKMFKQRKITCHTDTKVEDITIDDDMVKVKLSTGDQLEVDRVLVATGRKANTSDLKLDSVGIETEKGIIQVNDRMETSAKNTYCIGDANGRNWLAHAASGQGIVAVENALGGDGKFDVPVPACIFTFPEMGTVGLTQEEAKEQGLPISVGNFPIGYLGKALAVNDTDGFVKTIRHRETDELLGMHMMGHNVTECIAAAGSLMHTQASVHDIAEVIFAHPTISEAIRESAEDALGMALHMPPKKSVKAAADVE